MVYSILVILKMVCGIMVLLEIIMVYYQDLEQNQLILRNSTWHGGIWVNGEFHSFLNLNSSTGLPDVSDIHKYSIWRTGLWNNGDFWGGVAYNIDFKQGIWHGGILEEIQVIGVDTINPAHSLI
jgi:hypothetical protein